jgi:hypothetical protein
LAGLVALRDLLSGLQEEEGKQIARGSTVSKGATAVGKMMTSKDTRLEWCLMTTVVLMVMAASIHALLLTP